MTCCLVKGDRLLHYALLRKRLGALDFTLQASCKLQPSEQEGPSSDEMNLN